MGRIYNKDKRLESHRFFSYAAWTVVIAFAVFVYNITTELKEVTSNLQARTSALEEKTNQPVLEIDFEN